MKRREPVPGAARDRAPAARRSGAERVETRTTVVQAFITLLALIAALHARGFRVGFVGDDYTLLDAALRLPLLELLSGRHGILGYYRPISRELYFWTWGRIGHFGPSGFHLVNALTYAATVAMFFAFLRRWLGDRTALLAAAAWVVFPPAGALLSWISCAQDLIALFWSVAALLLYQRGRRVLAGFAVGLAVLSKETAIIVPFVIAAYEWLAEEPRPPRARWSRLAPAFTGLAVAVAIAIVVRFGWPSGTSVAVWSPRQMVGAWRLPLDFASTFWPPGTLAGTIAAAGAHPAVLVLVAGFAALMVPGRVSGDPSNPPPRRRTLTFALIVIVLGMLPVGVIIERWRGYFFAFAALGTSILAAVAMARAPASVTRALLAVAAVASFGANSHYRPVEAKWAPARHPHVNDAFFRETAALSDRLLDDLRPGCADFGAVDRRAFSAGVPRQTLFDNVLGPGLRVACRDTAARIHALEEFRPDDAPTAFVVVRFDPATERLGLHHADARTRIALAENFLLFRRYDVSAACFDAARATGGENIVLDYLRTAANAAARHPVTTPAPLALGPDSLTAILLARATAVRSETDRTTLHRLAAAVLDHPTDATAHAALGREVLAVGNPRQGAIELSIAFGIGRAATDLATLARAYEAMGALEEARAAYDQAITLGLPPEERSKAEQRREAIDTTLRAAGAPALVTPS